MSDNSRLESRQTSWLSLGQSRRARPFEWLGEKIIFAVSLTAILMVMLIFVFVLREALPLILGRMSTARVQEIIPVADFDKTSPERLKEYLGLTDKQFKEFDRELKIELMKVKVEGQAEATEDKDAAVNGIAWRYLLRPFQWTDYAKPEYIWQPVSKIQKYNIIPLFIGSLKTTLVALLFAVPLALAAAIYVSQLAPPTLKEWLKPTVELLAGVPSVVLGFFGLLVIATTLDQVFGFQSRLNALVAGIALGIAVIPVVFSIAEDALTSVPRSYKEAALALGSSKWQAAWSIILPAALPGVFAAVVLGFGRAIGETMVVLLASGNASIVSWSVLDSTRTITATIAAELAETVFGGPHYRILFLLGTMLFAITFLINLAAEMIMARFKSGLEGGR